MIILQRSQSSGLIFRIIFLILINSNSAKIKSQDMTPLMDFLHTFGYLPDSVMGMDGGSEKTAEVEKCLKKFQKVLNVPQTGNLDSRTMEMMSGPRCGNKDTSLINQIMSNNNSSSSLKRRAKRFVTHSKWEKRELSYVIVNYPKCCLSPSQVESEFEKAVELWRSPIDSHLTLIKVPNGSRNEEADIRIEFVRGDHNDGMKFANIMNMARSVAHAFYPKQDNDHVIRGDIHFNDEEHWVSGENVGENFLQTAAHELGHSLGLEHSMLPKAVMYMKVSSFIPHFSLHKDDIDGITSLYAQTDSKEDKNENDLETSASSSIFSRVVDGRINGEMSTEEERRRSYERILNFCFDDPSFSFVRSSLVESPKYYSLYMYCLELQWRNFYYNRNRNSNNEDNL